MREFARRHIEPPPGTRGHRIVLDDPRPPETLEKDEALRRWWTRSSVDYITLCDVYERVSPPIKWNVALARRLGELFSRYPSHGFAAAAHQMAMMVAAIEANP